MKPCLILGPKAPFFIRNFIFLFLFFVSCNSTTNQTPQSEINDLIKPIHKMDNLYEIDKEIIKNPKSPNVYLKRALYYQDKRNFNNALSDINRALSITPDVSFLQYHKAAILYELAVFNQDISLIDESKIYLDNCIQEDLEIIPPRLLRAKIFLFEKKAEEAMKLANQVLKIDKRIAEAYLIKGMIYHYLKNSKLASSSYQTAIEVDPNYFDAYIHMGMLSENLNNYDAVNYYNSAIEIEPNNIEAHRNKGLFYHFKSEYINARKSFENIISIDSNFEETYFNIGNTYLGQYDQLNNIDFLDSAFLYFKKATEINQFYVQALHNLGLCYEIKKDIEMATIYYKKAIEIDNNYTPSLNSLNSLD